MLKAVAAATVAVIAGSTFAYAQPRDGRPDGRFQPTIEDMRAFQAARLAALRAGLMLNAEQERHWPAFEAAMRELQQQRLNRFTAMREARRAGRPPVTDPAERMRQRAARLSESGAVLKRLADATDPLYRSLDEAQKRRFAILTRMGGPRAGMWQRRGRGAEPGMQRGQRRTEVIPGEAMPQAERMASRSGEASSGDTAVGEVFGAKLVVEEAAGFARKAIAGDPAAIGGTFSAAQGFSRKVIIGEPAAFGRKAPQGI